MMADRVHKVAYCYAMVPMRAGSGVRVLAELREAGVNLIAFSGFPAGKGRAQFDMIPEKMNELRRVATRKGWKLSRTKKAFIIQGNDSVGAVNRHIKKLAEKKISVTAADAVCAGKGRYGMILWVKPKDYARAARALGAV
jgi:hypothetical protein